MCYRDIIKCPKQTGLSTVKITISFPPRIRLYSLTFYFVSVMHLNHVEHLIEHSSKVLQLIWTIHNTHYHVFQYTKYKIQKIKIVLNFIDLNIEEDYFALLRMKRITIKKEKLMKVKVNMMKILAAIKINSGFYFFYYFLKYVRNDVSFTRI